MNKLYTLPPAYLLQATIFYATIVAATRFSGDFEIVKWVNFMFTTVIVSPFLFTYLVMRNHYAQYWLLFICHVAFLGYISFFAWGTI